MGPRTIVFEFLGQDFKIIPATVILVLFFVIMIYPMTTYMTKKYFYGIVACTISLVYALLFIPWPANRIIEWMLPIISMYPMIFLTQYFVNSRRRLRVATDIFIWVCIVIAGTAIMGWLGLGDGRVIVYSVRGQYLLGGLMYGVFADSSVNGILAIGIIFLLKKQWPRYLKIALTLMFVASIFLSLKRLAILALVFVLIYSWRFQSFKQKKNKYILPMIFGVLIPVFLPLLLLRFEGIASIFGVEQETVLVNRDETRIERFNYVISEIVKEPITGNGSGYVIFSHYGILEIIANMGIILSLPILNLWLRMPLKSLKNSSPELKDWAISALFFCMTILSFEASLNRPELIIFLGFFLGMIVAVKKIEKNEELSA